MRQCAAGVKIIIIIIIIIKENTQIANKTRVKSRHIHDNLHELCNALQMERNNILVHVIQRNVNSMPRLILEVIRQNGGHIRYKHHLHHIATNYSESKQGNSPLVFVYFLF